MTIKTKLLAPIAAIGLMTVASTASAYMVNDNYVGGDVPTGSFGGHNYFGQDVIGETQYFDIAGADASLSGTTLTLVVYTNFAGLSGSLYNRDTYGGNGIGYGDLLLSVGWAPCTGSCSTAAGTQTSNAGNGYAADDALNGNTWTVGFNLDNRFSNPTSASKGSGTIYELLGGNSNDLLLTQDFISCSWDSSCLYRKNQAAAVKTSANVKNMGTGSWWVTPGNGGNPGSITFQFDTSGLGLDMSNLGFHWDMTCGNDTIEGKVSVPEPGTVALLGLGLLGLGFARRKRTVAARS